jgi:hypothetical protein
MAHIIADENLQQALAGVIESVEVRTSDGILLGHYTPAIDARQALLHARYKHLWDLEEAERIAATEREGIPLAEVWKHIRSQEKNL